MSVGILCQCPKHPPGRTRANDEPACPHYAANQELGGVCVSCSYGWHGPCDQVRLPIGATIGPFGKPVGECTRCRWHSSDHR